SHWLRAGAHGHCCRAPAGSALSRSYLSGERLTHRPAITATHKQTGGIIHVFRWPPTKKQADHATARSALFFSGASSSRGEEALFMGTLCLFLEGFPAL